MKNNNKKFKYVGSVETFIKRVEVFSFSNCFCPFYTIETPVGDRVFGGAIGGSRLSEMEDPIFESRIFSGPFVNDFAYYFEKGESLYSYETAKIMHKVVADTGIMKPQRVLIDIFGNGGDYMKYALGGSRFLLEKNTDGQIGLMLDSVEIERM